MLSLGGAAPSKGSRNKKEEHSEANGHLERSSQNTNSDRPDGKKWTPPHPSPDSASLGKQGIGQILHLVPEARNPVKVNKISDSSSKEVSSNHHGSGAELGSLLYNSAQEASRAPLASPLKPSRGTSDMVDAR